MNDTLLLKIRRLLRVDFVKEGLVHAGVFCLFACMARAQLPDAMSPFAPAIAAAAFSCSLPVSALLGCAAGCVSVLAWDALLSVAVCLCLCWGLSRFFGHTVQRQLMLCVGAGEVVALCFFRMGSLYTAAMGLLSVAAAALLFKVYAAGLTVALSLRCRRMIASDEVIALALVFGTLLIGLAPLQVLGISIGAVAGGVVILLLSYSGGAGAGAACGVALGIMLSLGGSYAYLPAFGVLGLISGGMKPLKKPGAALGAVLGVMAVTMYSRLEFAPMVAAVIAAGIFLALPQKAFDWVGNFVNAALRRERSKQEYARRLKAELKARLWEYAQVLELLSRVFEAPEKTAQPPFDIQALRPVCVGCAAENRCWCDPERLRSELDMAFKGKPQNSRLERCNRMEQLYKIAAAITRERRRTAGAMEEKRRTEELVQRQLSAVGELLDSMTQALDAPIRFDDKLAAAVLSRLELNLTPAVDATVRCTEKGPSVRVQARECTNQCEGRMRAAVSLACGMAMEPVDKQCKNGCAVIYEPARAIRVVSATASAALHEVCGDNTLTATLDNGRQLIALCDGCGTGQPAAEESGAAIALLQKLYNVGMDTLSVMHTVNRLLSARKDSDMYTTMDCCVIDCYTGACDLAKQNAAATVWISRSGIKEINGDSLPAGILENADPAVTRILLRGGDWLFFVSDGVQDALEHGMAQVCAAAAYGEPSMAAAAVLTAAQKKEVKDDMTVLAVRIDENGP